MRTVRLGEIAQTIRSKNAGVHFYTLDVMFTDPAIYERVKATGALNRERIAQAYGVPVERITHFFATTRGWRLRLQCGGR